MRAGIIVPQGWTGEYDGWDRRLAWEQSLRVARRAEELGFDSVWAFDHFHTTPEPTDELTFESFTFLTARSQHTERVRLGTSSCAPASATLHSSRRCFRRSMC